MTPAVSMAPLDDRGLTLGDGLFETLLARDSELERLDAHLERLEAGLAALDLPRLDRADAVRLMHDAMAVAGVSEGLAAVRLTVTAGSGGRGLVRPAEVRLRFFATASAYARPASPAVLLTSAIRRNPDAPSSRLKTLAYVDNILARRAAVGAGADEALLLNTRGEVACATAANVFWIADGRLFTPALACGILAGVTRAALIASARGLGVHVEETVCGPDRLAEAEAIFLTNSLAGVWEARSCDGRALSSSALVERLATSLA